jgi:hypothetical protein
MIKTSNIAALIEKAAEIFKKSIQFLIGCLAWGDENYSPFVITGNPKPPFCKVRTFGLPFRALLYVAVETCKVSIAPSSKATFK